MLSLWLKSITDSSFFSPIDPYCLCPGVMHKLLLESRIFCFSTVYSGLGRDNLSKNNNILKYETDRCVQSQIMNAYLEEPDLQHLGFGSWASISSCPCWGLRQHCHRPSILILIFFFIIITNWPATIGPSWCMELLLTSACRSPLRCMCLFVMLREKRYTF